MKKLALPMLVLMVLCEAAWGQSPRVPPDCQPGFAKNRLQLQAGMHLIQAEVVSTGSERAKGLMCRAEMPGGAGMLFVFGEVERHCMWMRNTYLPLSVAFMDEQGVIVSIHDMTPLSDDSHCAARPARFALEMNQGWFEKRGIKAGTRITGLDKAPAPR